MAKGKGKWIRGNKAVCLSSLFLGMVLVMVWVIRPTLYDGWRHFYFLYPSLVILGILAMNRFRLLGIVVAIDMIFVVLFIITAHPLENVYFNPIISFQSSEWIRQNFELDYWGLSYRKGLEYIVGSDKSDHVPIVVANNPGNSNSMMLSHADRVRIEYLPVEEINRAKYFVTNYRWHPSEYSLGTEAYRVEVAGVKVLSVYKLD